MKKSKDRYDRAVGLISSFYHSSARKKEQHCYYPSKEMNGALNREGLGDFEVMYQNLYGKVRGCIHFWQWSYQKPKPSDIFDIAELIKRLLAKGIHCSIELYLSPEGRK